MNAYYAMMAIAAVSFFGFSYLKDKSDADVKIACYEAAKTNPNIDCKGTK